jgi:2-C-methyl-D-erythritol 4-phosphate cytidylyltransferase
VSTASTVALVPAAGWGERIGVKGPKALVPVNGVPLVVHAVRGLLRAGCVRRVVVAAPVSATSAVRQALADAGLDALVVPGGADRTESVRRALDAALGESGEIRLEIRIVLVHDLARALTPPELIRSVAAGVAAGAPSVVPVLPVTDTVKRVDDNEDVTTTLDRTDLRVVQGPQGFAVDELQRCLLQSSLDSAGRTGERVSTVPGHPAAMRITTAFDLTVASALLEERQ